jgi:uncharacterized protein (DUF2147 family)
MRFICLLFLLPGLVFADLPSPVGFWQQINEQTKQPQSVISIWQANDGSLVGKIVGVYPVKGRELEQYCHKCTDARKDQPIIGMTIMQNLRQKKGSLHWSEGEILDPKLGKTYRCSLNLAQDNESLTVRGYIGIPLLGRSQTWYRLAPAAIKQELKKIKT